MTPEDTFDLLADASGVRHPNPDRDNRGLCPAHGDTSNPALVFKIGETGHLIAFCHSQGCTLDALALSIGVETAAFFAGSTGGRFATRVPVEWQEQSVLDLLKLMPFGYDWDTKVECVFATLESDIEYATRPLRDIYKGELQNIVGIWLDPMYDHATHGDWWDWYDKTVRALSDLNKDTRTSGFEQESAIPRRSA